MELKVRLKELLRDENMTQKELAELTGLTEAQISAIASNRTQTVNKIHIARIANTLKIDDMNNLFEWTD